MGGCVDGRARLLFWCGGVSVASGVLVSFLCFGGRFWVLLIVFFVVGVFS